MLPGLPVRKGSIMENRNETVLESVEQLNEYLREHGDGRTVISIVLELAGEKIGEGSGTDGARA